MNAKRKGARNEHKSMRWLEARGYMCVRAAGSLGAWDLVAVGRTPGTRPLLVQVKTNRRPGSAELRRLRDFQVAAEKCIHIWKDWARQPIEEWL